MASFLTTHPAQSLTPLVGLPQLAFTWILLNLTLYQTLSTTTSDDDLSLIIVELREGWKTTGVIIGFRFFSDCLKVGVRSLGWGLALWCLGLLQHMVLAQANKIS